MRKQLTARIVGGNYNVPATSVVKGVSVNGGVRRFPTDLEDTDA